MKSKEGLKQKKILVTISLDPESLRKLDLYQPPIDISRSAKVRLAIRRFLKHLESTKESSRSQNVRPATK
jgi:hypothetical protein